MGSPSPVVRHPFLFLQVRLVDLLQELLQLLDVPVVQDPSALRVLRQSTAGTWGRREDRVRPVFGSWVSTSLHPSGVGSFSDLPEGKTGGPRPESDDPGGPGPDSYSDSTDHPTHSIPWVGDLSRESTRDRTVPVTLSPTFLSGDPKRLRD